jgi:hypothetical protein
MFGASNNDGRCANQRCRNPLPESVDGVETTPEEPYAARKGDPIAYRYCTDCETSGYAWCFECGQPVDPMTRRCVAFAIISEQEPEARGGAVVPEPRGSTGDPATRLLVNTLASMDGGKGRAHRRSPWLQKRMESLKMTARSYGGEEGDGRVGGHGYMGREASARTFLYDDRRAWLSSDEPRRIMEDFARMLAGARAESQARPERQDAGTNTYSAPARVSNNTRPTTAPLASSTHW